MSGDLLIRRADLPRDIDALLALDELTFFNPWTRAMYEAEAQRTTISHFFTAAVTEATPQGPGERLVAYCAAWVLVDELHINNVAVHPEFRRRGIARRLLEHVLEAADRRGAPRATLEVRESNDAARRLYEGLGFEVHARRPGYYTQPDEDALILWKGIGTASPATDPADPAP
jgi:ribosomal-protein-alanine N-acetyltransferase